MPRHTFNRCSGYAPRKVRRPHKQKGKVHKMLLTASIIAGTVLIAYGLYILAITLKG